MKKIFRKLASLCVTSYANRTFRNAIKVANSWYEHTGKRHYVITDPRNERKLVTISREGFCKLRHELGIPSKELTIQHLKNTCWYYTPNENKRDIIPAKELVIRRLAFVRDRLNAAGLLEK